MSEQGGTPPVSPGGSEFLKKRFNLQATPEVDAAARRTHERLRRERDELDVPEERAELAAQSERLGKSAEAKIENYLDRLLKITEYGTKQDPEHGRRQLKQLLHNNYVITEDEIPQAYFDLQGQIAEQRGQRQELLQTGVQIEEYTDKQGAVRKHYHFPERQRHELTEVIITDQAGSLDKWVDYLTGPDATYPTWLKYYAIRGVLGLGEFDKEKYEFRKRSKGTTKPFPDLNREALAYVLDRLEKKYHGGYIDLEGLHEHDAEVLKNLLEGANFGKLYAWALEKVTPASHETLQNTKGEWVQYRQGSDPMPLVQSLQGQGTGWCTAGESTARTQLQGGDFYVYYSLDDQGKTTIPRAAIRMEQGQIAEVRGVADQQNLDPYISEVVKEKLNEFPDGKAYEKKASDMERLTSLERKTRLGQALTKDELSFVYELDGNIEGLGYGDDPRVAELRGTRNPDEDMLTIFECTADQIAHSAEEFGPDTKAFVLGENTQLEPGIFDKLAQYHIEHVYTERFPEGKISFEQLEVGGKTVEQYKQALREGGYKVYQYAEQMMDNPAFAASLVDPETKQLKAPEQHTFVRLTVNDLFSGNVGSRGYVTTTELFAKAYDLGLEFCPPATGPDYRLAHPDQSMGDYVNIGMEPIADADGYPRVFFVYRGYIGRWLGNGNAKPDDGWDPDSQLLFRLRKSVQTLGVTEPLKD